MILAVAAVIPTAAAVLVTCALPQVAAKKGAGIAMVDIPAPLLRKLFLYENP